MHHSPAGNYASRTHHRIDRHSHTPAFLGKNEFRRRLLGDIGSDWPVLIVQVEFRNNGNQIHVGFVIRVEGPHIPPVAHLLGIDVVKIVGYGSGAVKIARDDVLAEVVRGILPLCVLV